MREDLPIAERRPIERIVAAIVGIDGEARGSVVDQEDARFRTGAVCREDAPRQAGPVRVMIEIREARLPASGEEEAPGPCPNRAHRRLRPRLASFDYIFLAQVPSCGAIAHVLTV